MGKLLALGAYTSRFLVGLSLSFMKGTKVFALSESVSSFVFVSLSVCVGARELIFILVHTHTHAHPLLYPVFQMFIISAYMHSITLFFSLCVGPPMHVCEFLVFILLFYFLAGKLGKYLEEERCGLSNM